MDHRSLKELLQQVIHSPEQQVYIRKLVGFDFIIEYKPGKSNMAADSLSRVKGDHEKLSGEELITLVSYPMADFLEKLKEENSNYEEICVLHGKCQTGTALIGYIVRNEILMMRGRYVLSTKAKLREELLREFHSTPLARHIGIKRTLVRLSSQFF